MKLNWGAWAWGLLAAFYGGVGVALVAAAAAFSLKMGFHATVVIMGTTSAVSGLGHMFAYLAEHPYPKWDGQDRRDK